MDRDLAGLYDADERLAIEATKNREIIIACLLLDYTDIIALPPNDFQHRIELNEYPSGITEIKFDSKHIGEVHPPEFGSHSTGEQNFISTNIKFIPFRNYFKHPNLISEAKELLKNLRLAIQ